MDKHPIGDLMETTMQKIREMVDVNTIIGTPIVTADGISLIPVSKVSFGFASGGTDFKTKSQKESPSQGNSFGGGSGAGVNIVPVAFLVVKDGNVRLINITPPANTTVDRVIELVPEVIDKVRDIVNKDASE
ncbi:MAG TPA: sporulation protein YtfJ [Papillibacter sp.]|jgi:sporulation protein YtfJ|nr:sporulation protein YtfJ [Papillibacter sp.]